MKYYLIKILEKILRFLAKRILNKYKPDVVGVTGSVGKTSTKEAIWAVLSSKFPCRKNIKNYNNELGVPLTIIGLESGKKSPIGWIRVFFKALGLIIFNKAYPKILVLEMAADKPGDIEYLISFVLPKVGVVTAIAPVHTEFFGSIENIIKEKSIIVSKLSKEGFALLNADDELVMPLSEKTNATVSTFGFTKGAEVRAKNLKLSFGGGQALEGLTKKEIRGLSFKVIHNGSTAPFFLPGVLGQHQVYSALAATAVGIAYGLNLVSIAKVLKDFKFPAGRMNLIPGIKGTLIIDDSYNSSPKAALAGLDVLDKINLGEDMPEEIKPKAVKRLPREGKRFLKFACLGDMAELGKFTEEGHKMVGARASEVADILVTVGEKSRDIAREAIRKGMHEVQVFSFGFAEEAGKFLQNRIHKGDLIFVKGSQVARMEKIVKELMAEPMRAHELLVRQGEEWQDS